MFVEDYGNLCNKFALCVSIFAHCDVLLTVEHWWERNIAHLRDDLQCYVTGLVICTCQFFWPPTLDSSMLVIWMGLLWLWFVLKFPAHQLAPPHYVAIMSPQSVMRVGLQDVSFDCRLWLYRQGRKCKIDLLSKARRIQPSSVSQFRLVVGWRN